VTAPDFPTRILLAVDGSVAGDLARDAAVSLVRSTGAELHVLHVGLLSPWTHPRMISPDQRRRLEHEAQSVLDAQVAALAGLGVTPTASHVRLGRATDEILRLRDEIDADLIVLGARGLNAFTRVLLGSDAEGVVRHAPCPVLVVRRNA
jgi:nucleotide-binding universal stress UspA family protein